MAGTAKKTKIPNFLLISILLNLLVSVNVNPPAEFRPGFALKSFRLRSDFGETSRRGSTRHFIGSKPKAKTDHPFSPASGISASLRQATGYSSEGE